MNEEKKLPAQNTASSQDNIHEPAEPSQTEPDSADTEQKLATRQRQPQHKRAWLKPAIIILVIILLATIAVLQIVPPTTDRWPARGRPAAGARFKIPFN